MKFNQCAIALTVAGGLNLVLMTDADESLSSVGTALAQTTLSGYVDTSAQWNFGTGNANNPPYKFGGPTKADGFNLDVVQITLEKQLDETEWGAGYRVDIWAGPDAGTLGTQSTLSTGSSDFAIRQAYVDLRVPLQNGIGLKVGVFDGILGYESVESPSNPNYTHSYGYSIEPQTHTGVLASYRFGPAFSACAGVADTQGPVINSRAQDGSSGVVGGLFGRYFTTATSPLAGLVASGDNAYAESYKTYMGAVSITLPDNAGLLSGTTVYGGAVNGYNNSVLGSGAGMPELNLYGGVTIPALISRLRLGLAFDEADLNTHFSGVGGSTDVDGSIWTLAAYVSVQATPKLSFHGRGEYVDANLDQPVSAHARILALTGTAQYDLWDNVLSRIELRWDHSLSGNDLFGGDVAGSPNAENAWMLAANVVYRF